MSTAGKLPEMCACGRRPHCTLSVMRNGVRWTNVYCRRHAVHKVRAMKVVIQARESSGTLTELNDPGKCAACGEQACVDLEWRTLCSECALAELEEDEE